MAEWDDMVIDDYCLDWLQDEIPYTRGKFPPEVDEEHIRNFVEQADYTHFNQQFDTYLGRAKLLGLDNPNGRQAIAKLASTALGMLIATVRVYGPLPQPGVSSGNGLDDIREVE